MKHSRVFFYAVVILLLINLGLFALNAQSAPTLDLSYKYIEIILGVCHGVISVVGIFLVVQQLKNQTTQLQTQGGQLKIQTEQLQIQTEQRHTQENIARAELIFKISHEIDNDEILNRLCSRLEHKYNKARNKKKTAPISVGPGIVAAANQPLAIAGASSATPDELLPDDVRHFLRFSSRIMEILERGVLTMDDIFPLMGYRILMLLEDKTVQALFLQRSSSVIDADHDEDDALPPYKFYPIFALHARMMCYIRFRYDDWEKVLHEYNVVRAKDLSSVKCYRRAILRYIQNHPIQKDRDSDLWKKLVREEFKKEANIGLWGEPLTSIDNRDKVC